MPDIDILKCLRLSERDATGFIRKLLAFYNSLNRKERAAFLRCKFTADFAEAAKVIDIEVSARELRKFMRTRGGKRPTFLIGIMCHDDDKDRRKGNESRKQPSE